ncbi:DUF6153 family protein [Pseudonocardia sp. ICBG1293]|uniref:DUF6153 family protein n=1 Tax=Pseudonocardia sp. ICBG1293 TaxID=2844382 RepID=UPI001CCBBE70|nr:DUF6153 family protein [Pseudonocardia sp. ICBG1293]
MTDRTRLLVLVLPVLLGLVGMHALAAPPASSGVHDAPAAVAHAAPPDGAQVTVHPRPHPDPHPRPHGMPHDGAAHLLHLCLAVLAAGIVLAAAALLSGFAPLPSARRPAGPGRPRTAPTARPPPVRRRLARLCVSRT